jgi:hypothetical protein
MLAYLQTKEHKFLSFISEVLKLWIIPLLKPANNIRSPWINMGRGRGKGRGLATAPGSFNLGHGWRSEGMLRSGRLPLLLIAETQIRFRERLSRICGGQSGTGTGYFPITSGFPCHCLSTTAPCSYFSHYQQRYIRVILQLYGFVQ